MNEQAVFRLDDADDRRGCTLAEAADTSRGPRRWWAKVWSTGWLFDGKPDFRGHWTRAGIFGTDNIEEHGEALGDPGGKSVVVDPADGKIPYQPWAAVISCGSRHVLRVC